VLIHSCPGVYEGSVRVPLVVRWPDRFDGSDAVQKNVNLCDLHATLSDLAGLPVPDGLDSRSLVPLLEGDSADWNDEAVSQHVGEHLMIKRGDLKYGYYREHDSEVLFDLERDPGETTNYVDAPEYADRLSDFRDRRSELGFGPAAVADYRTAGYET